MASKSEFHIDSMGFVRWNTNDNIPFDDMLEQFHMNGWITLEQSVKSAIQRGIETQLMIENYIQREASYPYSNEDAAELRAAFGEGATVVNVITGKKVRV